MPYNPRAPMMAPATQFPAEPLMDPLTAQMMQRRFGGAPQGLLDRSNAPAGLLGPATVAPDILSRGLLTPIIWDRLQRGLNPMTTTEGAIPNYGGGGRGQQSLDLQGGSGTAPPGYRASGAEPAEPGPFKLDWQTFYGGGTQRAVTKSGVKVTVSPDPHRGGTVEVMFDAPHGLDKGSTRRGIGRFGEVFDAVKDYVQGFRPETLRFTGLTEKHDRLYQRVAPLMAKELGGRLSTQGSIEHGGMHFYIDLPPR